MRNAAMNILLVEDQISDAEAVRACFEDIGNMYFKVVHAADMATALPMLAEQHIDAVMLDLFLPDTDNLEGLSHIQNTSPTVPVLILTGRDDEKLALEAVEKGAQDYILKDKIKPDMLQRTTRYAIQRKRFENAIIYQANYDRMTGLANRNLFRERLNTAIARQRRTQKGIALLMLDLNGFKEINDTYGHGAGDDVLAEVGYRILQCLRSYDLAARLGGDEFVVLIEGIEQIYDCGAVAQKLIEMIVRPVDIGLQKVSVGVSIGIAACNNDHQTTVDLLMTQADEAMYYAKEEGESCYRFYSGNIHYLAKSRGKSPDPNYR